MLALVALLIVGTSTSGLLPNVNSVDVASRPSHLNVFLRTILGTTSHTIENIEALGKSTVIDLSERLGWMRPESAHSLLFLFVFLLLHLLIIFRPIRNIFRWELMCFSLHRW
jgi:hypothetical protein